MLAKASTVLARAHSLIVNLRLLVKILLLSSSFEMLRIRATHLPVVGPLAYVY